MYGDSMKLIVVAHVADVNTEVEEVYLSCFNKESESSVPSVKVPLTNDLFLFRLNIPPLCTFDLRMFTRELPVSSSPDFVSALVPDPGTDSPLIDQSAARSVSSDPDFPSPPPSAHGLAHITCSRILRVEPLVHTVMTSPGWNTLLIGWNDLMQSWLRAASGPGDNDELLLMTVHDVANTDNNNMTTTNSATTTTTTTSSLLNAHRPTTTSTTHRLNASLTVHTQHLNTKLVQHKLREFPVGSGCLWSNVPVSVNSSTDDVSFTVSITDSTSTDQLPVVFHPRLRLSASTDWKYGLEGLERMEGLVACCQLSDNSQHVIAPPLYQLKRPRYMKLGVEQ